MIGIVDYGVGNIRAFANIYRSLNIPLSVVRSPGDLANITKVILPGVGAFDYAMTRLNDSQMRQPLEELVKSRNIPVLGVCVGMQMLAQASEEGSMPGLGWIPGIVKKLDVSNFTNVIHLPHMGWNDIHVLKKSKLFESLEHNSKYYFLHSYYFCCQFEDHAIATSDYGQSFACAVNTRNVFGVQFHPEKSHQYGIKLLQNFAEIEC